MIMGAREEAVCFTYSIPLSDGVCVCVRESLQRLHLQKYSMYITYVLYSRCAPWQLAVRESNMTLHMYVHMYVCMYYVAQYNWISVHKS